MRINKLSLLFILIITTSVTFGQANTNDCYPKKNSHNYKSVFHKAQNNLPDSIIVIGEVVSVHAGICGSLCSGGSIKVRLKNKIEKYPYKYIYLAVGCADLSNKCKMTINITATKLLESNKRCSYASVSNVYDMNDIPFYVISSDDLEKLQK
jgi:hypothetical protein